MNFARFVVGVAILTTFVIGPAVIKHAAAATKTPAAAAAAKPATVSAAAVTADVNLRKSPASNSELITLIPKGALVVVGTCVSGRCQVVWNGKVGYSIVGNLNQAGSALASQRSIGGDESAPPGEPPIVADQQCRRVNVRLWPTNPRRRANVRSWPTITTIRHLRERMGRHLTMRTDRRFSTKSRLVTHLTTIDPFFGFGFGWRGGWGFRHLW
jgi:uncharacterized protein YraI